MEDADEGADEVMGISVRTEVAAVDRVLDQSDEGVVNEAARAFDEAQGAARHGVHGGKNELFAGHMVNKEKHPGAKRIQRRHGRSKALPGGSQFFNFVAVKSFDQGVASGKVTIQSAWANMRTAGNVVERSLSSMPGKYEPGDLKNASRLRCASARGLRAAGGDGDFWFGIHQFRKKILQPETVSIYHISGDCLHFGRETR